MSFTLRKLCRRTMLVTIFGDETLVKSSRNAVVCGQGFPPSAESRGFGVLSWRPSGITAVAAASQRLPLSVTACQRVLIRSNASPTRGKRCVIQWTRRRKAGTSRERTRAPRASNSQPWRIGSTRPKTPSASRKLPRAIRMADRFNVRAPRSLPLSMRRPRLPFYRLRFRRRFLFFPCSQAPASLLNAANLP